MKNFKAFAVCCVLLCGVSLTQLRVWAAPAAQPVTNSAVSTKTANSPSTDVNLQAQMQEQTKALAELQARQNDLEKRSLDAERKSIDWWFAALAILTTVVAILGAFLPYLMGRKDKELLQSELQNARDLVASIKDKKSEIEEFFAGMKKRYVPGQDLTPEQRQQITQDAQFVANNPDASKIEKLYAQAVLASQVPEPTTSEQRSKVCDLWHALVLLDPNDGKAASSYAIWLTLKTASNSRPTEADWQIVIDAYDRAELLNQDDPDIHWIFFNRAAALVSQAEMSKNSGNLRKAQELWRAAGRYYERALHAKPNLHIAANSWGHVLLLEAQAMKTTKPDVSVAFLQQAQSLLEQHRDMSEAGAKLVAYNLACVYAQQQQADSAVMQLEVCRLLGELDKNASHWRTDPDLDPIRQSPEYLTWKKQHFFNE